MIAKHILPPGFGGATVARIIGEQSYWLDLPNGISLFASVRGKDDICPELAGATYIGILSEECDHGDRAVVNDDGTPRIQVSVNDATIYDREDPIGDAEPAGHPMPALSLLVQVAREHASLYSTFNPESRERAEEIRQAADAMESYYQAPPVETVTGWASR